MAKILVVDDKPHIRHVIELWLGAKGHDITCADDGEAALQLLRAEMFDILITDVDMPRMDGMSLIAHDDVVGRLRGVVVLTGREDYADLEAPSNREKIHFLPKPFSPTGVTRLVNQLVSEDILSAS